MTRASRGERAAFGRHSRAATKARRGINRAMRAVSRPERREDISGLVFVPPVRSTAELADVVARIRWYLPDLAVPVFVAGSAGMTVGPADAPHMDPSMVDLSGLSAHIPAGPVRYVIHRVTARTLIRQLPRLRRTTVADPVLSYTSENGYARLRDALCATPVPDTTESVRRLLESRVEGGTALALGTGPSASELSDQDLSRSDVRIICNSAVRNRELVRRLRPTAVGFADPVFHFGPSRYAAAFRADMLTTMETTDALAVVPTNFLQLLLAHYPQLSHRAVGLTLEGDTWRWPTPQNAAVRPTGNVLTNMMMPIALALADIVLVAGCDGRAPSENYFWKHNPAVQYDESLMRDVFEAHPAFFRSIDYEDYYERHCRTLEEFCRVAEAAGKRIEGVTRSHIPALLARGAPPFGS